MSDSSAVLQRVEEIEARLDGPLGERIATEIDAIWLCYQLRTALADTRRVDFIDRVSRTANCPPEISVIDTDPEEMTFYYHTGPEWREVEGHGLTFREAVDTAMAATPREA